MQNILIVEDDQAIRSFLKEFLVDSGYSVQQAERGTEALDLLAQVEPDLVILDLGLPDISGESLCRTIVNKYPRTKIIILTAKGGKANLIEGLNFGADDYLEKPFDNGELLARIQARLRENTGKSKKLELSDLVFDSESLEVTRAGRKIELTAQELRLLEYLLQNQNKVLTRDMILNRLWQAAPDVETRVVDVYIGYLRKKIDQGHDTPLIHSVRGFGYVMKKGGGQ